MRKLLASAFALVALAVAAPPAAALLHVGQCTFAATTDTRYESGSEPMTFAGELLMSVATTNQPVEAACFIQGYNVGVVADTGWRQVRSAMGDAVPVVFDAPVWDSYQVCLKVYIDWATTDVDCAPLDITVVPSPVVQDTMSSLGQPVPHFFVMAGSTLA